MASGQDLSSILDALPDGILETDTGWVVQYVNGTAGRLLGFDRAFLQGKLLWEISDRLPVQFVEAAQAGAPVASCDYERNGRWLRIDVKGIEHERRLIQIRDLTQAKGEIIRQPDAERALAANQDFPLDDFESGISDETGIHAATLYSTGRAQSEQQALTREKAAREQAEAASEEIRSILERIGDAYIAFDTEWRYTYVNHKAAELALKPASELIGRCVWDEFPEAVHTRFFSELHRAMRDQTPVEFDNYYKPLGKWFENSVYPSPSGVGVFYRDITERVRTQKELERRTAELSRTNAELETFAYAASHDLQEPLRIISGYADLLARRYSHLLPADANEFISFIAEGAERMQRLIKDLLALCRVGEMPAPPLVNVGVGHAVDLACANLDIAIEDADARVMHDALPSIIFNETQLLQLMQNLIANALKYRKNAPPRITVSADREESGWRICVEDNGKGFEMRHADQIFRPFARLHRNDDGGTGIGLTICRKIVENRGGRIWAESVPGIGSKFYFTVPDTPATSE